MAVLTPSSLISEIRGSVGDVTYSKNAAGPYVKAKLTQTVTNTDRQLVYRNALANAVSAWQLLTDAERELWLQFALSRTKSKSISRHITLAGYNEYVSRYLNRAVVDSSDLITDPFNVEIPYPWIESVTYDTNEIEVNWESLTDATGYKIVIYATPPLSSGINSPNPSLFQAVELVDPAGSSGSVNIFTNYEALYSVTGADIGKRIFFAIKAVNINNFFASTKSYYASFIGDIGFDADYQAVLDYATLQGWTLPSAPQQVIQNQLVLNLKAAGIWSQLDVFWVPANDGSEEFARINWITPGSNTISTVNSPNWTADLGYAGNGSTSYWNYNWKPSDGVNFTDADSSFGCRINNNSSGSVKIVMGTRDNNTGSFAKTSYLNPRVTTSTSRGVINRNQTDVVNSTSGTSTNSIATYIMQNVADPEQAIWRNGVKIGSSTASSNNGRSTQNMFGDAFNQNGTANLFGDYRVGLAWAGASLTGSEADMCNILNAYMAAI